MAPTTDSINTSSLVVRDKLPNGHPTSPNSHRKNAQSIDVAGLHHHHDGRRPPVHRPRPGVGRRGDLTISATLSNPPEDDHHASSHPPRPLTAGITPSKQHLSTKSLTSSGPLLQSPCFFHRRFDDAVNLDRLLSEIASDQSMSHSRLMQTATGVREVSKQLRRRPIQRAVRSIMIVTKARDHHLVRLTRELALWLLCTPRYGAEVGVNVYVDAKLRYSKRFDAAGILSKHPKFKEMLGYWTPNLCRNASEKFDLVLTLGGDGTVLYTSWLFQRVVPPVLSFNLGSLGFLTNFNFDDYKICLSRVMGESGMRVNLRMRKMGGNSAAGVGLKRVQKEEHDEIQQQFEVLNELVIDRGPSPYVSNLELYGDDELLTVVQADGCIFSTPTGSTAYSLSAGGSLVHPDIPAILLTPICPHTLSFRPMLLNDNILLRITIPTKSRATAYCSFDGKGRIELKQGDSVTIAASVYPFPTVANKEMEWFESCGRTLRWNSRAAMQKGWSGKKKMKKDQKEDEVGNGMENGKLRDGVDGVNGVDEKVYRNGMMVDGEDGMDGTDDDEDDEEDEDWDIDFVDVDEDDVDGGRNEDGGDAQNRLFNDDTWNAHL
ncbi:MAG: hypothetical protein M1823_002514 [Watsoniomyces obsoletus]|nr:MAG: hypothetical protein M1823_002514 [Watsoniomyces obsoletus]